MTRGCFWFVGQTVKECLDNFGRALDWCANVKCTTPKLGHVVKTLILTVKAMMIMMVTTVCERVSILVFVQDPLCCLWYHIIITAGPR